jgi:hypothetical protein
MQDQLDLYASVHKGLRNAMQATLLQLGRMDPTDPHDVVDTVGPLNELIGWLEKHLEIEERFVHSAIDKKRPGAVSEIRQDHEAHQRDFVLLLSDAVALEQAALDAHAERRAIAHHLYLNFSRFVGDNLVHMALEETAINALLWELFTNDELYAIFAQIISSESPDQLMHSVRWVLPALNPEQRAKLVLRARTNIPAPVFDQLLGAMRAHLSPRDFSKLARALEPARAA